MHMRVFAFSSLSALVVAVGGCGDNTSVPTSPTAAPSIVGTQATPALFYNVNGGGDVPVGEEGFLTFDVQNIGSEQMVVSSVTYTGDSAITLTPGLSVSTADAGTVLTTPITVEYNAALIVGLTCTPSAKATYNGIVDIKSNASNLPDITSYVQCVGLVLDGGT